MKSELIEKEKLLGIFETYRDRNAGGDTEFLLMGISSFLD
jgi:hypothetical protein